MAVWEIMPLENMWKIPEGWPVDPVLGVHVITVSKYEPYVSRRPQSTVQVVRKRRPPWEGASVKLFYECYNKRGEIRVKCSACNWTGYRRGLQCECYEDWSMYCRPWSPGPGCPSGILWPCPQCSGHGHDWIKG